MGDTQSHVYRVCYIELILVCDVQVLGSRELESGPQIMNEHIIQCPNYKSQFLCKVSDVGRPWILAPSVWRRIRLVDSHLLSPSLTVTLPHPICL